MDEIGTLTFIKGMGLKDSVPIVKFHEKGRYGHFMTELDSLDNIWSIVMIMTS